MVRRNLGWISTWQPWRHRISGGRRYGETTGSGVGAKYPAAKFALPEFKSQLAAY